MGKAIIFLLTLLAIPSTSLRQIATPSKRAIKLKQHIHNAEEPLHSKPVASILTGLLLIPTIAIADSGVISTTIISDWSKYFLAGGICASFSHGVTVPFDVVKTLKQTDPMLAKLSVINAAVKIVTEGGGFKVLLGGLGSTLSGYAIQGALKYGIYEVLKPQVSDLLASHEIVDNKILVFMLSGAVADTFASAFLSPFEASRIRLVTNPTFANGLFSCVAKMLQEEGLAGLFKGLPPLLLKQVPYTVVQLSTFDALKTPIYSWVAEHDLSDYKLAGTFAAALVAAVLSSLASQPGDTLLSVVSKRGGGARGSSGPGIFAKWSPTTMFVPTPSSSASVYSTMAEYVRATGIKGLFVGTTARLLHVGFIVVVQLLVYDSIKQAFGIVTQH